MFHICHMGIGHTYFFGESRLKLFKGGGSGLSISKTCTNNFRVVLGVHARNTAHLRGKGGVLAYFGHIFWDMGFKFVLPIIYTNIKGKTQLKVNWPHWFPKNHKNGHISKRHFGEVSITKIPTPPTFLWICLKLSEST